MEAVPRWAVEFCRRELGATPVEPLLSAGVVAEVVGVRLDDGREVVLKSRADERGRAAACVAVQRALAASGFPCASPLGGVTFTGGRAIHAEEWRPGGEMLRGDDPETAARFAVLLARLVAATAAIDVAPPLPNPAWVRWDHRDPGLWPADERHDARAAGVEVPAHVEETARRLRMRIARVGLPCIVGHADWETQNLRWHGSEPHAVHDWDSLAWLPEAAIAGAAAGAFASAETPTLAPLQSSEAFLAAYEAARGRSFAAEERELAWAAGLWLAVHNARAEVLYGSSPVATTALRDQATARLARAGA